jgi:hypothetical protein
MNDFNFEKLRQAFTYCQETGVLVRNSNGISVTGLDAHGYVQVGYLKKMYKAHRLIWAMIHGEFPDGQIDHINGNRSDNRLCNLRVVTQQQNAHNKQKNKRNKSGFTGVCWNKKSSKWQACISVNAVTIYLGVFHTAEQAHAAYLSAKSIHHITAPRL